MRGALVLALTVGLSIVPTAAHAEGWLVDDPSGDVSGYHHDPDPEPCGTDTELDAGFHGNEDLVGFSAHHTRTALRLVARFSDIDESLEQGLGVYIQTPTRAWQLDVGRHWWNTAHGEKLKVTAELTKPLPEPADGEIGECGYWTGQVRRYRCRIERAVDLDRDRITATVPRACIGDPEWVRLGAGAVGWDFPDDWQTAGYSIYSDQWGEHPDGESDWDPPLGPQVRSGR